MRNANLLTCFAEAVHKRIWRYGITMRTSIIIFALLIGHILLGSQPIYCQAETFDIFQYMPPPGWTKSVKEGAVVYTKVDKNTFCLLTVYAGTPGTSNPQTDFANNWDALVLRPLKADAHPKTETQTTGEGWQATAGGSRIEMDGGLEAIALLTVFSGFGKSASVLVILNDQSYLTQMTTFVDNIKLDKTKAVSDPTPTIQNNSNPGNQRDPFPDKPGYQPQKPLAGMLKDSITMADLVGKWDEGGASVVTYVDSSSGNYSGTNTTFYAQSYAIRADGTFDHKFQGRTSNHTVRESSVGTITLSGGYIIVKFTGGERKTSSRYQFVSYMTLPNGGAVLSLVPLGESDPLYDANWLVLECGHGSGYIHCVGGEEWLLSVSQVK